jgi:hypothetical protein
MYITPVIRVLVRDPVMVIAMIFSGLGVVVSGWVFRGLAGVMHSTESLILAQDERWRRA